MNLRGYECLLEIIFIGGGVGMRVRQETVRVDIQRRIFWGRGFCVWILYYRVESEYFFDFCFIVVFVLFGGYFVGFTVVGFGFFLVFFFYVRGIWRYNSSLSLDFFGFLKSFKRDSFGRWYVEGNRGVFKIINFNCRDDFMFIR